MIRTKMDLQEYLLADSLNYKDIAIGIKRYKMYIDSNPISDQFYIWKYIYTMRHVEYHINNSGTWHKLMCKIWLWRLRKCSYKTSIQIAPNTCDKGLTIWHWGAIIINSAARLGEYCTLYPDVLIGHKNPGDLAPQIGSNVFIGAGSKIIGNICIGNNVTVAPNSVVVKNLPDNVIAGGIPAIIIKKQI